MGKAFRYAMFVSGGSLLLAILAALVSYILFLWDAAKGGGYSFLSNLLLNVVAEFVGLGVGIFIAALVAHILAKKKLDELAPEFVRLVAALRHNHNISGQAARSCVICAVKFISEENLEGNRDSALAINPKMKCPVCKMDADVERINSGGWRCGHCKLKSGVWNIDLKLEEEETSGEGVQAPHPSPQA